MMTTIFFIFSNFFILLKLIFIFLSKIFLINMSNIKYILILWCSFLLYLIRIYPPKRFKILSKYRKYKLNLMTKYKLKTTTEKIYNICVILLGFFIFIVGLFFFRYVNSNQILDLKEKYMLLKQLYNTTPLHVSFLNISLLILIFFLYICVFIRILKYYKYHIIKRHLYFIGNLESYNFYEKYFLNQFCFTINFCHIYTKFLNKIETLFKNFYYKKVNKKQLNFMEVDFELVFAEYEEMLKYYDKYFINPLKFLNDTKKTMLLFEIIIRIHYIFLIIILIYDIIFNDFKIILIYNVLPWTFLIDFYIRFSLFVDNLWSPHDKYLNTILYSKHLEIWDKNTLIIDGEFYDYNHAKIIYRTYVARDFVKDFNNL